MSPLDQAPVRAIAERVYRIALSPQRYQRQERVREATGSGPEFQQALDLLSEDDDPLDWATLDKLLDRPFVTISVRSGRFSDGTHPVLYTALEWETAGHEYGHWIPTNYGPVRDTAFCVRLHLISCDFAGQVKDIRPFLVEYPWLIANDHVACQRLGAIATAEILDGLLAPSARRDLGTTVPVLVRGAVSKPRQESEVIFRVDPNAPDGMKVTFSR